MARLGTPVRFALVLTLGIVAGFGLSIGHTVRADRQPEPKAHSAPTSPDAVAAPVPWQDARLLAEVLEHVRKEYVERISDEELIEAAIRSGQSATARHYIAERLVQKPASGWGVRLFNRAAEENPARV